MITELALIHFVLFFNQICGIYVNSCENGNTKWNSKNVGFELRKWITTFKVRIQNEICWDYFKFHLLGGRARPTSIFECVFLGSGQL